MTIKEFYSWARERNLEDFNFLIEDEDSIWDIDECMFSISLENKEFIVA